MPILLAFLLLLAGSARAAVPAAPVVFAGDTVTVVHDGSPTAYNPHSEAGRLAIRAARDACCVVAPPGFRGRAEPFSFNADLDHHLLHEAKRFVVDAHTGAFVSTTTFEDPKHPATDPRRYVDSDLTPMVSLSAAQVAKCGCAPGDRVLVTAPAGGAHVWAIYGNNAGEQEQGEAFMGLSTAAAAALHIPLDPVTRDARQIACQLTLTVFPGSGPGGRFPRGGVPPVAAK